jgi:hypothetical protein
MSLVFDKLDGKKRPEPLDIFLQSRLAIDHLRRKLPDFTLDKLLTWGGMGRAAEALGNITEVFTPSILPKGYRSWLAKLPSADGKIRLSILVDWEFYEEMRGKFGLAYPSLRRRFAARMLAICLHEAGHAFLGHAADDSFTRDAARLQKRLADPRTLPQECDAWLWSCYLRALVFAEVGGSRRPDGTADIV